MGSNTSGRYSQSDCGICPNRRNAKACDKSAYHFKYNKSVLRLSVYEGLRMGTRRCRLGDVHRICSRLHYGCVLFQGKGQNSALCQGGIQSAQSTWQCDKCRSAIGTYICLQLPAAFLRQRDNPFVNGCSWRKDSLCFVLAQQYCLHIRRRRVYDTSAHTGSTIWRKGHKGSAAHSAIRNDSYRSPVAHRYGGISAVPRTACITLRLYRPGSDQGVQRHLPPAVVKYTCACSYICNAFLLSGNKTERTGKSPCFA